VDGREVDSLQTAFELMRGPVHSMLVLTLQVASDGGRGRKREDEGGRGRKREEEGGRGRMRLDERGGRVRKGEELRREQE